MIVLDTSVALKWVLNEAGSDRARTIMALALTAPDFWRVEAGNGLRKSVRRGEITPDEAAHYLQVLSQAPVRDVPTGPLLPIALELAIGLSHPLYDCLFLALALDRGCRLLTADEAFVEAVGGRPDLSAHIVSLADFVP
ncbi:type II toxin-antitoxin system VapC family toxin [Brevundimonas aurifodinae]|uniref:Ribonuclease VapC n=2 Tax=Brevundimonas TaxID=41275 RepID=A0ABV1NJK5_9CAUL|nr:MAG: hypothetical protein B7Z01_13540 [Brevundimonas subvibrioides]